MSNDYKNYYENQLKKLNMASEFPASVIVADGEGTKTKTLTLNVDSCEVLINFLTELKVKLENESA